jgi:hypothetical protein
VQVKARLLEGLFVMLTGRNAHPGSSSSGLPLRIAAISFIAATVSVLWFSRPVKAYARPTQQGNNDSRRDGRSVDRLFSDEMKSAIVKVKWHGERLTQDTIYALALTGASWEPAWDKVQMFSLAWGDSRKVSGLKRHGAREKQTVIDEIRSLYLAHQFRRLVDAATAEFSLDEIGCDVSLKEYVGASLMALGQPEQAFPVYSAPFDPPAPETKTSEHNRAFREAALESAIRAGLRKEAVAFSLSLLLEPDREASRPDEKQIEYLKAQGVDIDRVLLGILQSPERLRGLPTYYYPAADLVAYRASPRVFPMLLQLSDSSDVYLRARALLGLGLAAFRPRNSDPGDWYRGMVYNAPQEYGISTGERRLIDKALRDGAASDKYRLRASAALGMGLTGDDDYTTILHKLSKDRAFVLTEETGERSKSRRISFPVRMAASASLQRLGISTDPGPLGVFSGRELDRAKHGGSDETNDRRGLRKDEPCTIMISPVDVGTGIPNR